MVLIVLLDLTKGVEGSRGVREGGFSSMFQITIGSSTENVLGSVVWLCFPEEDKEVHSLGGVLKANLNDRFAFGVWSDHIILQRNDAL